MQSKSELGSDRVQVFLNRLIHTVIFKLYVGRFSNILFEKTLKAGDEVSLLQSVCKKGTLQNGGMQLQC